MHGHIVRSSLPLVAGLFHLLAMGRKSNSGGLFRSLVQRTTPPLSHVCAIAKKKLRGVFLGEKGL